MKNLPLPIRIVSLLFLFFNLSVMSILGNDISPLPISRDHKCATCGMRVAEFTNWHSQMVYPDNTNQAFCAVKCLMAYYFEPSRFSDSPKPMDTTVLFAKDYYTQTWHNMKEMIFVTGSDIMGPMGRDLMPFSDINAAQSFLKDHNGEKILKFEDITLQMVQQLRHKKGKGL